MTSLTTTLTHKAAIGAKMREIGNAAINLLVSIAEKSPVYRQIEVYNALSDEELAERGMTRQDVVKKVFGPRAYM